MHGRYWVAGAAGCGKTTFGQRIVENARKQGTSEERIAFVAFNVEAAHEAAKRCGVDPKDRGLWFRTLHSACYKLMGEGKRWPQVLKSRHKRQFAKEFGLDLSPDTKSDEEESLEGLYWNVYHQDAPQNSGDAFMQAYNASRLCCRSGADLDQAEREVHPRVFERGFFRESPAAYRSFVRAYEEFKFREGVVDFIDMVAFVVRGKSIPPQTDLAIIDEDQDLSPLLHQATDVFFANTETVVRLGDDKQAIFSWAFGSADDFLAYRQGAEIVNLAQTHRFGSVICDLANRVAGRLERTHPMKVIPKAGAVNRVFEEAAFDPDKYFAALDGKAGFILHRHVAGCRELGKRLIEAGIPFRNERGIDPLGRAEKKAYISFMKLGRGESLNMFELLSLLDVVPWRKEENGETVTLTVRGAKTKYKDLAEGGVAKDYRLEDLGDVFTDVFLDSVRKRDLRWLNIEHRAYYDALLARGFDVASGRPNLIVTTIHGSKGRQADLVALFTETFPRALANPDEHRVGYVGCTRTAGDLWVVQEQIVGNWTLEYDYPVQR